MSDEKRDDLPEPLKAFVPPPFTSDLLVALRQAPGGVIRSVLAEQLARRALVEDGTEMATALDKRIVQIRAALGPMDVVVQPNPPVVETATVTPAAKRSAENWEDIELSFIGDHDVEVRIGGGKTKTLNYKDIAGCENQRDGKPNKQWTMLRLFGGFPDGKMPEGARHGKEWEATRKTIERINKALRKHFQMTGDPIIYSTDTRTYRARIQIRLVEDSSR